MKLFILLISISFISACGSGAGKTAQSDSANATSSMINTGGTNVDTAENIAGNNLIAANDCLTCHKVNQQAFGPSYKQIAGKYELNQGNVENLADKIIKGGKGLWGQNVMTPHPNLTEPQAQEMSRYILSLRNPLDTTK